MDVSDVEIRIPNLLNGGVIMPIIKSAKKKLRQDKKRTRNNLRYELAFKKVLDQAKKHKKADKAFKKSEFLKNAYSVIDKAAKVKVIHKNKAARLKARVSKFVQ